MGSRQSETARIVCASGGENFSALRSSSGENLSAVSGRHSRSEAVNFTPLSSVRLEWSDHFNRTSCVVMVATFGKVYNAVSPHVK